MRVFSSTYATLCSSFCSRFYAYVLRKKKKTSLGKSQSHCSRAVTFSGTCFECAMKPSFITVTFGLSSSVCTGIQGGCPTLFLISAALKKCCSNSWSCKIDYAAVGEIERSQVSAKLHIWHTVSRFWDYTAFKPQAALGWKLRLYPHTWAAFFLDSLKKKPSSMHGQFRWTDPLLKTLN